LVGCYATEKDFCQDIEWQKINLEWDFIYFVISFSWLLYISHLLFFLLKREKNWEPFDHREVGRRSIKVEELEVDALRQRPRALQSLQELHAQGRIWRRRGHGGAASSGRGFGLNVHHADASRPTMIDIFVSQPKPKNIAPTAFSQIVV
jgi:hypothetical protein